MKIAVIGSGISGLSSAWLLSKLHYVVVYEADDRIGGHANTYEVKAPEGPYPVDTGFIVYNEATYPNFTALLDYLEVPTSPSRMTFSASFNDGAYEYSGTRLSGLFAQKSNLFNREHWRMMADIVRFFRTSVETARTSEHGLTLRQFLEQGDYSDAFINRHILPMSACIWSTPLIDMLDQPLDAFIQFFDNHGLLKLTNRPQWRTVTGGSKEYIKRLVADRIFELRLNSPVWRVSRHGDKVEIQSEHAAPERFDHVVLACHPDQALLLLDQPNAAEQHLLSKFQYSYNRAVLHTDDSFMPKRKQAWASWNYLQCGGAEKNMLSLTYWMNSLQPLPTGTDVFVTLNPGQPVASEKKIAEFSYAHPQFNAETVAAQKVFWNVQGQKNTWFCGAWLGAGFHEDGLQSGLAVAEQLGGVMRPWSVPEPSGRIHVHPVETASIFREAAE